MIGQTDHATYTPALSYHPLANLFPMIEGPERVAFRQSIRDKGLRVKIVMHEGMILDGRNRYRELLGLQLVEHGIDWTTSPYFRAFGSEETDGDDPLAFVLDLNLDRRHLNESQRASVAARMATMKRGERTDLKDGTSLGDGLEKTSRAEAAERLNVSERSVNSAKHVQESGSVELINAVDQGVLAVSVAEQLLTLPAEEQTRLVLEETPSVIRNAAKKAKRADKEIKLAAKQKALPNKRYGVVYVDPAWRFEPRNRETGLDRAADNHYPTMTTEEIIALPVGDIAAPDCAMFMWATVPMLTDALKTMAAWGFAYKSQFIWDKTPWDGDGAASGSGPGQPHNVIAGRQGQGFWGRVNHEILLLGTRGTPTCPAPGDNWPSVYREVAGEHSVKPEHYARMIESYFPNLPKIELNARGPRDGWEVWGNESEGSAPPAKPEKPVKAKKDKRHQWEIDKEARDARIAELMAPMSDDLDDLRRAYAAAIHHYHGAFLATDEASLALAAETMEAILLRANGGDRFGIGVNERPQSIKAACAAQPGEVPFWGQEGTFVAEAEGVQALVTVGGYRGGVHAVDLNAPFPSSTGFHSVAAPLQLGQTVEDWGADCIRESIKYANRKDKDLRAAQRGLMMPERVYRIGDNGDVVAVSRGVELPDDWVIGEVSAASLASDLDTWLAECKYDHKGKRKFPECRHLHTPIFAFRYRDGVPIAAAAVDDFPASGEGYVFRRYNGGARGWTYVAGGEATSGIFPRRASVQEDPCPDRWVATSPIDGLPDVTPQTLIEMKILWALMAGQPVTEGPVVTDLMQAGLIQRSGGKLELTQRGYGDGERLGDLVKAATDADGKVRVAGMVADANVSSAYAAELQKVAHLKGKLHQSTAEAVMKAGYAERISIAQLEADLGHPKGTIKTWANRLKLTSIERMHENQAPAFTAADGFDQMSATVPDVNGDAVKAGLKVTLAEDVVATPYEVRRVYKNGNISISNASGHQQVIKAGEFVLAYEEEPAE